MTSALKASLRGGIAVKEGLMYTNTLFYTDSVFGVEAMIDTGCSLCVIDSTYASSLGLKITTEGKVAVDGRKEGLPTCVIDSIKFCEQRETADIKNKLTIRPQKVYKNINIKISNHTFNLDFFEGRKKWGLLGLDFLEGHSFILNYKERTLEIIP